MRNNMSEFLKGWGKHKERHGGTVGAVLVTFVGWAVVIFVIYFLYKGTRRGK